MQKSFNTLREAIEDIAREESNILLSPYKDCFYAGATAALDVLLSNFTRETYDNILREIETYDTTGAMQ